MSGVINGRFQQLSFYTALPAATVARIKENGVAGGRIKPEEDESSTPVPEPGYHQDEAPELWAAVRFPTVCFGS